MKFYQKLFLFFSCMCYMATYGYKVHKISIPKTGTYLLQKCLTLLDKDVVGITWPARWWEAPDKQYQKFYDKELAKNESVMFVSHTFYSIDNVRFLECNNIKVLLIYRDPRDQIISAIYYIQKDPQRVYKNFSRLSFNQLFFALLDKSDLVLAGPEKPTFYNIKEFYCKYLSWMNYSGTYVTTFEKLVGPKGGGSKEVQLNEIVNIAHHIDLNITVQEAERIVNELFGGSYTFREGQIGSWKKHFTEKHKEAFKEVAGQLLIDLGYEKDMDW